MLRVDCISHCVGEAGFDANILAKLATIALESKPGGDSRFRLGGGGVKAAGRLNRGDFNILERGLL
jgi:hypothetical protein